MTTLDIEKRGAETDGLDEGASKSAAGDGIPTDISGGFNDCNPSTQDQIVPSLLNRLKQLQKQNASCCFIHYFIYLKRQKRNCFLLSCQCFVTLMHAHFPNKSRTVLCVCVCVCVDGSLRRHTYSYHPQCKLSHD